jgi:hypothetical protein
MVQMTHPVFARNGDVSLPEYDVYHVSIMYHDVWMYGVQHAICNVHHVYMYHDVQYTMCNTLCNRKQEWIPTLSIVDQCHMRLHALKRTKSFARVLALMIRSFLSLLSTLACFNFSINSFPSLEATALGNNPSPPTASCNCAALYFSLRVSAGSRKYLDALSLSFSAVLCCVFLHAPRGPLLMQI